MRSLPQRSCVPTLLRDQADAEQGNLIPCLENDDEIDIARVRWVLVIEKEVRSLTKHAKHDLTTFWHRRSSTGWHAAHITHVRWQEKDSLSQ